MAQLAQAKIQETTASTLSALLGANKANVNVSGSSSSLFASFLNETSTATLPTVEPYSGGSSASSAMTTKAAPQQKAASYDTPAASRAAAPSASSSTRLERDGAAKVEVDDQKAEAAPAETKAATAEPADATESQTAGEAKETAQTAKAEDTAATQTDPDLAQDEAQVLDEDMAALMAMLAVAEPQKSVTPVVQTVTKTEAQAAQEEGLDADAQDQGLVALLAAEETGTRKSAKAEGAAESGAQTKTDLAQTLTPSANAVAAATARGDAAGAELVTEADLLEDGAEDTSVYTKMIEEATTKTAGSATQDQGQQQNAADMKSEQDYVANAQNAKVAASAAATAQAGTQAADVSGEPSVQGASSTNATQNISALASGTRPVGSYDFASQLSAARVTKGGTAGLPQAVEQVAVQLHKAVKEGADEITIQLRPAELGKIEVKLEIGADKSVTGTVIAESQATLNMLQKDSSSLQRALQEAGLQADAGCMQFSLRDEHQANQFGQNQAETSAWKTQVAAEQGGEALDELTALTSASETYYLTPGRVNLRV